jgi:putative MATE family efflux protein
MGNTKDRPAPMQRGGQIDIEVPEKSGKRRLIISLTWPSLAENVLASLVSMVDMVMVGVLGAYAISAVGLVIQPRFVMLAAFMALSVGSTAMVSRFKGARDQAGANLVFRQSIIMTIGLSLIVCISMRLWGETFIRFIAGGNIAEETVVASLDYLYIQVYGFPILALTFCINAALRGVGNTRAAFYNNTAANLVNVFFNYCLINGNLGFPKMGVAGASLATVIGQCVAFGMALFVSLRGREYIRLQLKGLFHIDFSIIRRILKIGVPAMVEQLIMRIGMLLFTMIVTALGDGPYAAHMVAMNVQQLSFMTGMAFGTAATTLVGQCLGRGKAELARVYVRMSQNMGLIASIIVALLLFFGGRAVSSLYTEDIAIIILASDMLKIIALANPISNARFVYISALRGAGDSRFAAVITFVGVLLVRPLIAWALTTPALQFNTGLYGVWIALVSDGLVCFVLAMVRYKRGKWASIKV